MDFTLSEEQELLRDTARSLLAKECPTSLVRAHIDDPAVAEPLTKRLSEWAALVDGPLVDLCLFLEQAGAALAPGPFVPSVALFAPLAKACGLDAFASVAAGELTGTVAMADADGAWVPNDEPTKHFVPEAERVDVIAVVASDSSVTLHEQSDVRFVKTVDFSRRLADVDPGPARGQPVTLSPEQLADVAARWYVALAAETLGAVGWIFDATLAYAKERVQFDRPIGSFQAVKHKLANMALAHEQAWSAVYYAAMTIDSGDDDRQRAAHVAKITTGEAAHLCVKEGIQIHGGIGYTWEHDLQLFVRRVYGNDALLGTVAWHQERLAELLL